MREGQSKGSRSGRWRFAVTLETPDRQFVFLCDQEQDQREWIEAFKLVISQPMLPQHYNSKKTIHCSPCDYCKTGQWQEIIPLSSWNKFFIFYYRQCVFICYFSWGKHEKDEKMNGVKTGGKESTIYRKKWQCVRLAACFREPTSGRVEASHNRWSMNSSMESCLSENEERLNELRLKRLNELKSCQCGPALVIIANHHYPGHLANQWQDCLLWDGNWWHCRGHWECNIYFLLTNVYKHCV